MLDRRTLQMLVIILVLASTKLYAQGQISSDASPRQRAIQEVDAVLTEANSVTDKAAFVKVKAQAASLVWFQNQERSRELFSDLWAWVNSQDDAGFDREAARTQILKRLFTRDPKLATKLLKTSSEDTPKAQNVQRLTDLASGLIRDDPSTAAGLLGQSLSAETSAVNVAVLERLRKRDISLADSAAAQALTSLKSQPAAQALLPAYSLIEYIALTTPAPGAASANVADEALRRQFYSTAYGILLQTLQEAQQQAANSRPRTDNNTSFKTFPQAQLAGVLAALASRYAPEHAIELNALAARLSAGIPPQLNELSQYTLDRINGRQYKPKDDSPAGAISAAIVAGDFDEAKRQLIKLDNEDIKKFYSFQIATKEFEADMAQSNLAGAIAVAKAVDDIPARAFMFAQVIKVSYKKGDTLVSQQALSEARIMLQKVGCDAKKAVAILALATAAAPISISDSVELLNGGTACINSLGTSSSSTEKKETADHTHKFMDLQDLQQAFSSLGKVDLDNALLSAGRIDDKPTALIARLSACEAWLHATDNPTKTVPAKVNQVK
jgi:hypothetical protein